MRTPTDATVDKVKKTYPPIGQGGFDTFAKDAVFACHAQLTANAWRRNAYRYSMSIPPATHGQDQFYYLYLDSPFSPARIPSARKKAAKVLPEFHLGWRAWRRMLR